MKYLPKQALLGYIYLFRASAFLCFFLSNQAIAIEPVEKVIILGSSESVKLETEFDSFSSSDIKVCRAESLGRKVLLLNGDSLGLTKVHVLLKDGTVKEYSITVIRNIHQFERLEKEINNKFTGTNIHITILKDSEKVLVEGTATDQKVLNSIIEILTSKTLNKSDIICNAVVPCEITAYCAPCTSTYRKFFKK